MLIATRTSCVLILVPSYCFRKLFRPCTWAGLQLGRKKPTLTNVTSILIYYASDKIVGILLDRSRSHDSVKITVLGVEIRIGRLIEFEAGGEQSKMADDELVAMDLS